MILSEGTLVIVIQVPGQLMLSWEEGGLAQSQMLLCPAAAGAIRESGCVSQDGFEGLRCRGHGQDLRASIRRPWTEETKAIP